MDKTKILAAALALAETLGYEKVLKRHVAKRLHCGMGTINYHWGTMRELRTEIVREAVRVGNKRVVLQAIAAHHHAVRHFTDYQRACYYT